MRVLYVDDEDILLNLGKEYLESIGDIVVCTTDSADKAEVLVQEQSFDAIICDYQMPGKSGIDFLNDLRSVKNNIPFILFTGKGREEVVIEALNKGADYYVKKGGEPESQFMELFNAIKQSVSRRDAEEAMINNLALFKTMLENSRDVLMEVDQTGQITFISPSVRSVIGVEPETIVGSNIFDILTEDERDAAMKSFTEALKGKKVPTTLYTVKKPDGCVIKVAATGSVCIKKGKSFLIISMRDTCTI